MMSKDLTVSQLHEIVGGRLRLATLPPPAGEQTQIGRVVIDSRQVQPGDTFWGLVGKSRDGGSFAEDAYDRRAGGAVVAGRYVQPAPGCWSLEVDDAAASLTKLAAWNRSRFAGRAVAVTGSVGKTTTRQMIHAVLGRSLAGSASPRNYNNHLGVPLSLLGLTPTDDYTVLELAASAPGEIGALAELARPEIGVITRLGEAHLGGFGSPASLVQSKLELLDHLPAGGWAVLSGDDERLRRAAGCHPVNIVWVGRSLDCDLVATDVCSQNGCLSFKVDGRQFDVPVWGRHHLVSALAAIAVGKIFGLPHGDIVAGLACFEAPPQRCEISHVGQTTIINDTYNASPTAMRAALELLRDFQAPGRRIVVCGDMRELGEQSEEFHRRLGDEVVTLCGADLLVVCGQHAQQVAAGARQAGMAASRVLACRSPDETIPLLDKAIAPGDVVLVKGSRALAMERLVTALESRVAAKAA
jgi:UDP-N-acetylmuramoyl-tripeptide--D-alanyl-D-alanine ligase